MNPQGNKWNHLYLKFTKTTSQAKHEFTFVPQAMKSRDAKAAVDKEWKKLETIPAWQLDEVKSKKNVLLEAQRDKNIVHSATLMDICPL